MSAIRNDGHGRRIKSTSIAGGTQTSTWYLYDAQGRLLHEYTGADNPPLTKTYYYRGSEMVTTTDTNNNWRFLVKNALGSTRLISGNGGTVVSRMDYLPFGGLIPTIPWRG
ncbi:MAG: hypothetical protein HY232_19310 [Acidobacteria bacterium]|nr:hypothetical protein [Acidobacteriota bacterium]